MRIISQFHDYYDGARYLGGAPVSDTVFVRKTGEEQELPNFPFSLKVAYYYMYPKPLPLVEAILIGFCGKIYVCWESNGKISYGNINHYYNNGSKRYVKFYNDSLKYNSKVILESVKQNNTYLSSFFLKEKVPYWKIENNYDKYYFTACPNLEKLSFYKVFSAPLAYQEIEMYMNSVLVEKQNIPQIVDNKTILEGKGFDNKISFRHPVKIKE